jgi:glycosyltransferase involved in cell wall biosynthesis
MTANRVKNRRYEKKGMDLLNDIKPDIVHAHYITKHGFWAAKTGFRPLVLSAWGSDIAGAHITNKHIGYIKYTLSRADLVHTADNPGKDRLIELGCDPDRIFVQQWGVDLKRFSREARSDAIRNRYLSNSQGKLVTIVYALEDQYNLKDFISAAAIVRKKNEGVNFIIIGEGSQRKKLEGLSQKENSNVRFLGRVPHEDMPGYLASSDLYVDTYFSNVGGGGIGVATMEALACGLPVVAARRPGVEIGVHDGENGYIYNPGNPHDLAEKILLALSKQSGNDHSEVSRSIASDLGDWGRNMAAFEAEYSRLIEI